jgi:predicted metal-binding membrane protein
MNHLKVILWHGLIIMIPTSKIYRKYLFGGLPAWVLLGLISVACWMFYLTGGGTGMTIQGMSTLTMPFIMGETWNAESWSASYTLTMVGMWWTMMIAMMLPGAFVHFPYYSESHGNRSIKLLNFGFGYAVVWLVFSIFATALQYAGETSGFLHGMKMWSISKNLSIALLVTAGIYQFTCYKRTSLLHCYESNNAKHSSQSGLRYGLNCLQSSWALMLLLFVGGSMNIYWMVSLAVIVALEKIMIKTRIFSFFVGTIILILAALSAVQ